jgi:transcriptional regulator
VQYFTPVYIPPPFHETDLKQLDWLLERDAFGTLISTHEGAPFVTHLPVLYRRADAQVTLRGHWARANPQWSTIEGQRVLLIIHGPHAYISPRWYTDPVNNVPTWNYATAHLYGHVQLIEESARLAGIVKALAEYYEAAAETPWRMSANSANDQRLRGIVGFELTVDEIQLKFKLNQNHPAANIEKVVSALRAQGGEDALGVAALMQQALAKRPSS